MMPRPIWKGDLAYGLFTVPVQLYKAVDNESALKFREIHEGCGQRLKHPKTCPGHGEVPAVEVGKAYEVGKNRLVPFTRKELDAVKMGKSPVMEIEGAAKSDSIKDVYADQRYYLGPGGHQTGYVALRRGLEATGYLLVAKFVMNARQRHCTIQPYEERFLLTTVHYADHVRAIGQIPLPKAERLIKPAEAAMVEQVLKRLLREAPALEDLVDNSERDLMRIVREKEAGQGILALEYRAPPVIDLMEALKASLLAAGKVAEKKRPAKGRKKGGRKTL